MTRPEDPVPNNGLRNLLRGAGIVLVIGGLILAGIGFASFFSAMGSNDSTEFGDTATPDKFWLAFIGMPMIGIGGWCLAAGFLGTAARYAAREGAPLINQLGSAFGRSSTPPPPPPTTAPAASGSAFCRQCGTPMPSGSRFCGSCGASV